MSIYHLPGRAFLRLSGPDAERYLNGQITQKVADADQTRTLWTAVTNAQGGIEGVGCLRQLTTGDYLIDCPVEIGDEMEARLDRYLIADDCEWSREDEQWQILVSEEELTEGLVTSSNRYRTPRMESVVEAGTTTYEELPLELEQQWRVMNGVPAWGSEVLAGMLPAECGLYQLALSFDKGCYIGQEIISRMETAGRTRTKLYRVQSESATEECSTVAKIAGQFFGLMVAKQAPEGTVITY